MPNIPICVFVDGDFQIDELVQLYKVLPVYVKHFKNQTLAKLCTGSTKVKFASIWESPFEKFVCVDSDVVAWGDISKCISLDRYNFNIFTSYLTKESDYENVCHYLFDIEKVKKFNPKFKWLEKPIFCAGAFGATRDCLNLGSYLDLEQYEKNNPGTFKFEDQGFLNYLVLLGMDSDKNFADVIDLQYVLADRSKQENKARLNFCGWKPPKHVQNPKLLHFCGIKPLIQNFGVFSKPFTSFRLMHYENFYANRCQKNVIAWSKVIAEEIQILKFRMKRKAKKLII
jgi:hypothetical protein